MSGLDQFIRQMPKVELHVHLEGSVRAETLLKLARRHHVSLPADSADGLREWYRFRDFTHFVEIYMTISSCLRSAEDIELITREFLIGQSEQNIEYSEVTFTPYNQYFNCQLGFHEQMDAVNRARRWGERELDVRIGIIIDIPREHPPEAGMKVIEWVAERFGDGIIALGLGGPERGNSPEKFRSAFDRAREKGIPCIPHAGETDGPASIWSALRVAGAKRIGHGVRSIEDPTLIAHLRDTQIPLEVCPTSNICLGVFRSLEEHCLPLLIKEGLFVTINSDDPPMFNTTLTNEYLVAQRLCGWESGSLKRIALNAVDASLLSDPERRKLRERFESEYQRLFPDSMNSKG
jgi:adenosine deaminase